MDLLMCQDFVEKSLIPMIIFYKKSGKIIATNASANAIFGKKINNVFKVIGEENKVCELNEDRYSILENNFKFKINDEYTFDCEYNLIMGDISDRDIVLMIFDYSYRSLFLLEIGDISPSIHWEYISNKRQKKDIKGNAIFWSRVFEYKKSFLDPDANFYTILSYKDRKELKEINQRICINKKNDLEILKMIEVTGKNRFIKFSKMPLLGSNGEVFAIVTLTNFVSSTDSYMQMIDKAFNGRRIIDRLIDDSNYIMVCFKLDDKSVLFVSSNIRKLGYSAMDFIRKRINLEDFFEQDSYNQFLRNIRVLQFKKDSNFKIPFMFNAKRADGQKVTIHSNMNLVYEQGEKFCNCIMHIVEKRKNNEISTNMDEFSRLIDSFYSVDALDKLKILIFTIDKNDNCIKDINKIAQEIFANNENVVGQDFFELMDRHHITIYDNYYYDEIRDIYYAVVKQFYNNNIIIVTMMDITSIINKRNFYKKGIDIDGLTGLGKRIGMDNDIRNSLRNAIINKKNSALVAIEIRDFNGIKKEYGMDVSDNILRRFVREITKIAGMEEHFYRMNSNIIFAVVDSSCNLQDVLNLLQESFKAYSVSPKKKIKISVNMGVALFPETATQNHFLIENALSALGEAKKNGNGKPVLYHSTKLDKMDKVELKAQIYKDVFDNYKNFEVMYHPIKSTDDQRVLGGWARIKWYSNKTGLINPLSIIDSKNLVYRDYIDYIISISESAIYQSFQMCKKINDNIDSEFKMIVKVPSFQILRSEFFDKFEEWIRITQVNSENIILDISEIMSIENETFLEMIISNIKKYGCKILTISRYFHFINEEFLLRLDIEYVAMEANQIYSHFNSKDNKVQQKLVTDFIDLCNRLKVMIIVIGERNFDESTTIKRFNAQYNGGGYAGVELSEKEFENIYLGY